MFTAALVFLGLGAVAGPAPDRGDELREAAVAGDRAQVLALLDAGTPVDAPARHGSTALHFAAEKGHLDVVHLLMDRGARVDARETFFGSSALQAALRNGHRELARFLLEHGAEDAADALEAAVRAGDLGLAKAFVATGRLEPLDLLAARKLAEGKASPEMSQLLASTTARPPQRPPYTVPAERLAAYAGRYRAGDGTEVRITVDGHGLRFSGGGQPETAVTPVAPDRFLSADGQVGLSFGGRAGLVEGGAINRAGAITRLSVATADPQPLKTAASPGGTAPAPRGAARPWPQFRGPGGSGVGDGQGAPLSWNIGAGENVRFKTPLPGIALSSPIVWGDRIFVTTAVSAAGDKTFRTGLYGDGTSVDDLSEHSFRLYALDRSSGRVVWEREVHRGRPAVRRHLKSSLANATPATDGRRVVALFGAVGLLAAYDLEGRPLWRRQIGVLDCNDPQSGTAEWGHASSPILYEGLAIVQGDRRRDSFVAAYRLDSGEEAWRVARDEGSTWSTPNVLRAPAGDELLTNGRTIRSYEPRTGRLLWTLGPNSEVVVSTPVVGDGVAYITAGYPPVRPVYAVRPGHRGDLTLPEGQRASPAVAWSHPRGGTYIPTPLLYRDHLYTVNNNGILTCYRSGDGELVYQTRLGSAGTSFAASPVAADGRLYFASEAGEVFVLRAGSDFELLATNAADEVVMATPAISDGMIVLRTLGHVVGISEGGRPVAGRQP